MSATEDFIQAPPPLFKYRGGDVIHDDNLKIIQADKRRRSTILPRKKVKELEARLKDLQRDLDDAGADERIEKYNVARQELNSLKIRDQELKAQWNALKAEYQSAESKKTDELLDLGRMVLDQIAAGRKQIRRVRQKVRLEHAQLRPLRDQIKERNKIRRRLTGHYTAVEEHKKESLLSREMAQEAELVAQQMSYTLSRLGFVERVTRGKQTITRRVEFEMVIATPDQLQFKLKASRQGMFGGTIELLPNGVHATDILTTKVMNELSMTLEREVWSPQVDEDISYATGGWIIVERMGLYEGIPRTVTYRQIMARYETADHHRIPLPAGLKRGRRINWTYLDSHSSTHVMFTGITGSGKSNAIQACIAAVVETQSPRDVLFCFIDLKDQGDFTELSEAPHALTLNEESPIITKIPDVVELLKAVRAEMHWRQARIGSLAKNINAYNKRVSEADRLPRIVVLFDEYANVRRARFSDEAEIIDDICTEITQIGRASGIHLWIGIQQPRRSNMPQALRDNFVTTFVGHQANIGAGQSVTGNRTSLKLPDIPGRMLAFSGWKQFEVQMPLVSEDDINNAVRVANRSYGDLEKYELHYNRDEVEDDEPLTTEQVILDTAFNVFDGALKKRAIWEHLKPRFSLNEVTSAIEQLLNSELIEYDGEKYHTEKKPGGYFLLVKSPS